MQIYIDLAKTIFEEAEIKLFFCGCDYNCPFCFVPDTLRFDDQFLQDIKEVKSYIEENISSRERIIFSGGEPMLQKQALLSLARFTKKLGLKNILDTNASKPNTLRSILMSELFEEIWVDIKSTDDYKRFEKITRSKTFFIDTLQLISNIKDSIKILKQYETSINIIFITSIVPSLIVKKQDLTVILNMIKDIRCTWVLNRFRPTENHVDKRFRDISPPTQKYLESLKADFEKHLPVEIWGIRR